MTVKHLTRPIDEQSDARPTEQASVQATPPTATRHVRPEVLRVFLARWKRNEPGYRFLADR